MVQVLRMQRARRLGHIARMSEDKWFKWEKDGRKEEEGPERNG